MQSNIGSRNTHINKKYWSKSQGMLLSLCLISVVHFFIASHYVDNQLDIKLSMLIVKRDGCDLLTQYGIPIQPHGNESECRVTVPFEMNLIGTAGKIYIGDQQIRISENQVVVVGSLENHSWTPQLRWLISWLAASLAIMLGLLVWAGRAFRQEGTNNPHEGN